MIYCAGCRLVRTPAGQKAHGKQKLEEVVSWRVGEMSRRKSWGKQCAVVLATGQTKAVKSVQNIFFLKPLPAGKNQGVVFLPPVLHKKRVSPCSDMASKCS